jgi:hypothetical protein
MMRDNLKKAEEGHSGNDNAPDTSQAVLSVASVPSPKARRPFAIIIRKTLSLFIGFVWLGPALTLLVLNFKGYIIGAGIGCDGLECRIDPYSTNQVQQAQALDDKDHDILGALQFVAKALEIWFMFIAGNLVYNVALRLAKKNLLPLSLLTTYAEFLDILYLKSLVTILFNIAKEKKKATQGIPPVQAPSSIIMPNGPGNISTVINTAPVEGAEIDPNTVHKTTQRQYFVLYCFITFVAFMSILANLMGTSTAILLIPTVNWIDINQNNDVTFVSLKSSEPPREELISPGCTTNQLAQGTYSCSSRMYAASLDSFMDTAVSSRNQEIGLLANAIPPLIQEGNITATLNISERSRTIWVPTRKTLRDFSTDLNNYYYTTTLNTNSATDLNTTVDPRYPDSARFNQALQARLQRKGPIIGLGNNCVRANQRIFPIDVEREVLCFPRSWDTKCIRWGSGWRDTTQHFATFDIDGTDNSTLRVGVWETDRASYLSKDDINKCNNGDCNWDALLSAPPTPDNINISGSSLTFQYSFGDDAEFQLLCHTAFYISFANYVLDPSPLSNILSLVELNVIDDSPSAPPDNDTSTILSINPDWLLFAWSANKTDGLIRSDRSSGSRLLNAAQFWLSDGDDSEGVPGNRRNAKSFNSLHQYSIVQALSMIPYDTSILDTTSTRDAHERALKDRPRTTATLSSHGNVRLWKYGIDSRTAKLGVTIVIIGCLCVFARLIIYLEESKSPTELVVTALQHPIPNTVIHRATGAPVRVSYINDRQAHRRALSFGTPGSTGIAATSPPRSPPVSP